MYKYVGNGKGWLWINMLGMRRVGYVEICWEWERLVMYKYIGNGKGWLCINILGMRRVGYV